ncbi:MAG: carbamoyltransferase C-terminal domain-containing protein [Granulosicoccus sp.]
MRVIGLSPLDKDSTVCLVEDGVVLAAIAEERLSRKKMHAGFPYLALQELFEKYNLAPDNIDAVVYAFFDWEKEKQLMVEAVEKHKIASKENPTNQLFERMRNLPAQPDRTYGIPGLDEAELYIRKSFAHESAYKVLATQKGASTAYAHRQLNTWLKESISDHQHWSKELAKGLEKFGLNDKLQRIEHHLTHAANAFFTSSFEHALIVTLDGYGSGLGGSISVGEGSSIKRVHSMPYPVSLGEFYERVTSSLGFTPGRHEGKIVGLAAYESPDILYDTVRAFFEFKDGDVHYHLPHNFTFSRYLATRFSKPTIAAAFQKVLEDVICEYISHYVKLTGLSSVVLSGGVVANVKANQRIFEIDGVDRIFVHPNMGDGGCGVGAALIVDKQNLNLHPYELNDVYWGPDFSEELIAAALAQEGMEAVQVDDIETAIAGLLADGHVVARFNGRMEYGPRSLGNRSILYHARDPDVNLWLNQKLNRTEFMPFAPATLFEERHNCYLNMDGAEYTSRFMTITFDCTEFMKETCPAAVHVDGTARPQLVSETSNPSFYKVIKEYQRITGIPSIINTSFNMHEEPIVCTPKDAIRAFLLGDIPYLAIGKYLVAQPVAATST